MPSLTCRHRAWAAADPRLTALDPPRSSANAAPTSGRRKATIFQRLLRPQTKATRYDHPPMSEGGGTAGSRTGGDLVSWFLRDAPQSLHPGGGSKTCEHGRTSDAPSVGAIPTCEGDTPQGEAIRSAMYGSRISWAAATKTGGCRCLFSCAALSVAAPHRIPVSVSPRRRRLTF